MARYSLASESKTLTAVANTTNFTDNGYAFFLQGGSSTMRLLINEVQVTGESTTPTTAFMRFGRDSTVAATSISGCTNANIDGSSVAPGTLPTFGSVSTTKPQRSSTLGNLLMQSINAYGGGARWQARPGEEIILVGNTASLGELSYSAGSGSGAGVISAHLLYEIA